MMKDKSSEDETNKVNEVIEETEKWLLNDSTKEEYDQRYNDLNKELNPILMKIQSNPTDGVPSSEVPSSEVPNNGGTVIDEVD